VVFGKVIRTAQKFASNETIKPVKISSIVESVASSIELLTGNGKAPVQLQNLVFGSKIGIVIEFIRALNLLNRCMKIFFVLFFVKTKGLGAQNI